MSVDSDNNIEYSEDSLSPVGWKTPENDGADKAIPVGWTGDQSSPEGWRPCNTN